MNVKPTKEQAGIDPSTPKGTVYFFTGLAGAGKTTIGGLFFRRMKKRKPNVVLIDGDQFRYTFGHFGYSNEERLRGAWPLFRLCNMLAVQGMDVVCCSMSLFDQVREWNKEHIDNYKEIYIKVSMETLVRRDQKGLYTKNRTQVVGVDLPFEEPKTPDLVVVNDQDEDPVEIVKRIEQALGVCEE